MESEEMKASDHLLTVILPEGQKSVVTVQGSQPVIDLLVTLCAQYHLNPSEHFIELISSNQKQIKFKPNSLIGLLEAEQAVLKPKQNDDCNRKVPSMPVPTVRLIINYRKSHKAVVRVNPRLPLFELIAAVCDKCELDPKSTVLLRNSHSEESLDLTKTLNDYGIRELYAKEMKDVTEDPATPTRKDCEESVNQEEVNRGLLGFFRGGNKTSDEIMSDTNSASNSLEFNDQISSAKMSLVLSDISKKRRAPQPPSMPGSHSISSRLISTQDANLPKSDSYGKQRTKGRAPPPPGFCLSKLDSSEKERPYVEASFNHKYFEDAQEDRFSGTSFYQYSDSPPASPLMKEILLEFMDRLKAKEQVEHSSDRSTVSTHTSNLHFSVHKSVDSENHGSFPQTQEELMALKDGLTFNVIPNEKTQSPNHCKFGIMLDTSESGETGEKMEEIEKKTEDKETSTNYPPASRHEPHRDSSSKTYLDRLQLPLKYQSPDSKFGLNSSFSNEKLSSQNLAQSENPSLVLTNHQGPASNPEPLQTVRFPFACVVSPFALTVSQRAMSVRKSGYPLNLSTGGFSSLI